MRKGLRVVLGLSLAGVVVIATAQPFPLWERLLRYYGGKSDTTNVPSMKMGDHMQMSLKGTAKPGDQQRARQIVGMARKVVAHYSDARTALGDGYKAFAPTGKMGEEVHYSNYRIERREQRGVDYEHPGSILFKRTPDGMKAIGVMYTAPQDATAEQLNAIAPLSIAAWHRHVDFCGGPRNLSFAEQFGPHAAFGPQGSIHNEEACNEAGGLWIPVVFGWMTHVYPDAQNPKDVWGGMDMHMDDDAHAGEIKK